MSHKVDRLAKEPQPVFNEPARTSGLRMDFQLSRDKASRATAQDFAKLTKRTPATRQPGTFRSQNSLRYTKREHQPLRGVYKHDTNQPMNAALPKTTSPTANRPTLMRASHTNPLRNRSCSEKQNTQNKEQEESYQVHGLLFISCFKTVLPQSIKSLAIFLERLRSPSSVVSATSVSIGRTISTHPSF